MKINYIKTALIILPLCFSACSKDNDKEPATVCLRPVTESSSAYVSKLYEYKPGPGQFINKKPGDMESAQSIIGKAGSVTLGAWGGFIVLGFDHTVMDRQDKEDILIKGNANSLFAEPGVVWVMQDVNGNGLPDDVWYELAGSAAGKDGYIRNYSVTYTKPATPGEDVSWKDNQGKEGVIKKNSAHKQSYFPEWISGNSYTLTGTLLPSSNIDASKPAFITSKPFDWGYADNLVAGDKLDIAHAIDAKGNKAVLKGIDFIKIQTGLLHDMGWLGEQSTELTLVADLELFEKQK